MTKHEPDCDCDNCEPKSHEGIGGEILRVLQVYFLPVAVKNDGLGVKLAEIADIILAKILASTKPCDNKECDHGRAMIPGKAETDLCPVCKGTGSVLK